MKHYAKIFMTVLAAFLLAFSALGAAVQTVAASKSADVIASCRPVDLQTAIDAASSGATLTWPTDCMIALSGAPIRINKNIILDGVGHHVVITRASGTDRLVNITGAPTVTLRNLTFNNGNEQGGTYTGGGAIYNAGSLTVEKSTFTGNATSDYGGAIKNASNSSLTVVNSTFFNNSSILGGGAIAAPETATATTVSIVNSTFVDNQSTSTDSSHLLMGTLTTVAVRNTIFYANPSISNSCSIANWTDGKDGNLSYPGPDDLSSYCPGPVAFDPMLASLRDNGGPTQTFAFNPGNPVNLSSWGATCPGTDQRGVTRPLAGADPSTCYPGAYEYVQPTATTTTLSFSPIGPVTYGTPVTITATVNPHPVVGMVVLYDGTTPLNSLEGAPVDPATGTMSFTTSAIAAGTRSITAAFYDEYKLYIQSNDTDPFVVNPVSLEVTADAKHMVYGDTPEPALTFQITKGQLMGSDTIASVFSGSLARAAGSAAATYPISQGSLAISSTNYTLTKFTGADFIIDPREVVVTANARSKVYGEVDPDLTYTVTPTTGISETSFTGSLVRAAGSDAGTYAITQGSLALVDALKPNYWINFTGANLTINPKALTIQVTPLTPGKVYGDTEPEIPFTTLGLVGTDTVTGKLGREAGENAGSYALKLDALVVSSNYTPSFAANTPSFVISKKAINITAAAKSKAYGDADPALTYTVTPALAFTDQLTGELKRAVGENANDYAISQNTLAVDGSVSANYNVTYTGANLTISKATLTFTADNKTRGYKDANPPLTYQVSGFKFSDGTDLFAGKQPVLATSATAGGPSGNYPITISAGDLPALDNYAFAFVNGTLVVEGRKVYLPLMVYGK